jgi:hypothetical protein
LEKDGVRNYRLKALAAAGLVFGALVVAGGAAFLATGGLVASPNGPTVSIESGQLLEGGTEVTRLSALDVSVPGVCGFTVDVV